MPPVRLLLALAATAATCLTVAPARPAAAAETWAMLEHQRVPLRYYQGLTHVRSQLFFVGLFTGGYLTGGDLREQRAQPQLIPADVAKATGFNHVGDPTYDPAEGGRLLLGLECYRPLTAKPNSCGYGGIGVIDPATLAWRYWVRLDGRDVAKAMWLETAPAGDLVWTSSGRDLVAYRTADIASARAATGRTSPPIRPARRLRGAVPPSGVAGAAFAGDQLLVAGGDDGAPSVWAVDLATGKHTRQLRLAGVRAEAEGIDVVDGRLLWLLAPGVLANPTYGQGHSELLTYVAGGYRLSALATLRGTRLTVTVRLRSGETTRAVPGATVRAGGRAATTSATGVARLTFAQPPRKAVAVTVAKGDLRRLTLTVRPAP